MSKAASIMNNFTGMYKSANEQKVKQNLDSGMKPYEAVKKAYPK